MLYLSIDCTSMLNFPAIIVHLLSVGLTDISPTRELLLVVPVSSDSKDEQKEGEEFKTSKFFCKIDFNMAEIAKEEKDYAQYPLPKFYNFPSVEARERILYANFLKVNQEVKDMIAEIQEFYKK